MIYSPHEIGAYKFIQISCNGGLYHFNTISGSFQTLSGKTLDEVQKMCPNRVHLASELEDLSYDEKIKYCDSVLLSVKK